MAMLILAIALIAFNCALCLHLFVRKRRINSPFQFFYLLLLGLGLFPGFWDLQPGVYDIHPYSPPIFLTPAIMAQVHSKIALMLIAIALLDHAVGGRDRQVIDLPRASGAISAYDGMIAVIVLVLMAGIYIYGFGLLGTLSFGDLRFGAVNTYSLILFYLQVMVVGIPAVYWLKSRRRLSAVLVLFLFMLTYLFLGGSRQTIIISLACVLAMALVGKGRWAYALLILGFSLGFSFADVVLQVFKAMRNLGSLDQRIDLIADLVSGRLTLEGVSSESALRLVMYNFLHQPPPLDFGNLDYFRRMLLFWLPSALDPFGIKPADFEYVMFAEAMNNREGTMHPVFFGSIFADARWFFIVWVIWFVLGFRLLERIMLRLPPLERAMVWCSCIYLSFMAARGSLYAPFVITGTVLLLAWLSTVLRAIFSRQGRPVLAGDRWMREGAIDSWPPPLPPPGPRP